MLTLLMLHAGAAQPTKAGHSHADDSSIGMGPARIHKVLWPTPFPEHCILSPAACLTESDLLMRVEVACHRPGHWVTPCDDGVAAG